MNIVLDPVGCLALPQGLVEPLAQGDVWLGLGALDELLHLPGAGTGGFVRLILLLIHGGLLLHLRSVTTAASTAEGSGKG